MEKTLIKKQENTISHILEEPYQYISQATLQSKEWTMLIINLMLNDKLLSEVYDDVDKRPLCTLKQF